MLLLVDNFMHVYNVPWLLFSPNTLLSTPYSISSLLIFFPDLWLVVFSCEIFSLTSLNKMQSDHLMEPGGVINECSTEDHDFSFPWAFPLEIVQHWEAVPQVHLLSLAGFLMGHVYSKVMYSYWEFMICRGFHRSSPYFPDVTNFRSCLLQCPINHCGRWYECLL